MNFGQSAFIYLDDLLDAKEHIYVRNTSPKRGIVVLTLNDGNRTKREVIPNIRYPICLSNKANPDMIRSSTDLRTYLDRGILSLVSREDAEKELSKPGVKQALLEAYSKLETNSASVRKARGHSETDSEDFSVKSDAGAVINLSEDNDFDSDDIDFEDADDSDMESTRASRRVQILVESLLNKDLKSREVRSELMGMELTEDDLTYIIDNTSGVVQKYAKERFAEVSGRDLPQDDSDLDD